MKDKIIDYLLYGVIIITVLVILIFQKSLANVFLGISICSIFLGVLLSLKGEKYGAGVSGFGIAGISSILLYRNCILDYSDSTTFMMASTLGLYSLLSIIFDIINVNVLNKKYSMMVVGKVIDLEVSQSNNKFFKPVYGFEIDKDKYEVDYPMYISKGIPGIGDDMPIFVNPDNYEDVYFKRSLLMAIRVYAVSILLLIACIGIVISLFV